MTEGYAMGNAGGAISASGGSPTIEDSAITDSVSGSGGGISAQDPLTIVRTKITGNSSSSSGGGISWLTSGPSDELRISESTISGNTAGSSGGGVDGTGYMTVENSEISGNHANGGNGGGILAITELTLTGSTLSGNTASGSGGAISQTGKYAPMDVSDSVISGNSAAVGGGLNFEPTTSKYGSDPARRTITGTTIADNDATGDGAGMRVATLNPGDRFTISHSTISGNEGGAGSFGGGIMLGGGSAPIRGAFDLIDSTVSGNTADTGAGVSFGRTSGPQLVCDCGSIDFDN